jgi:hypothetical protein
LVVEVDTASVVGKELESAFILDAHARVFERVEASLVDRFQFCLAQDRERVK